MASPTKSSEITILIYNGDDTYTCSKCDYTWEYRKCMRPPRCPGCRCKVIKSVERSTEFRSVPGGGHRCTNCAFYIENGIPHYCPSCALIVDNPDYDCDARAKADWFSEGGSDF